MALTDRMISRAKIRDRKYRMSDGDGLSLVVTPKGRKLWYYRYMVEGKARELSLGSYPAVSLAEARQRRDKALSKREHDIDPVEERAAKRATARAKAVGENSFERIAREYMDRQIAEGLAEQTIYKNERFLLVHASPILAMDVRDVKPADILSILKGIEADGKVHTAHRVRSKIGEVFRYAISTLRCETDPTYALKGAIRPEKKVHRAAITEPRAFGRMLRQIDCYDGWHTLRAGLQMLAYCYPRPIELRLAEWNHVDLDEAIWHLPMSVTKMRREHEIPLSRQAVAILRELREVAYSETLVFPQLMNGCNAPISENGMNVALRRMGIAGEVHCSHGFRASASTLLNRHGFDDRVIEASLAHLDPNEVRRTYNRYRFWNERVAMAQAWADLCDEMKTAAKIRRYTPEIA